MNAANFKKSALTLCAMLLLGGALAACGSKPAEQQNQGGTATTPSGSASGNQTQTGTAPATGQQTAKKTYSAAPEMKIDKNKTYTATVTTSKGAFKIELFAKDAPVTVNNFVFLSKEGFYNNVTFHRIIKSFMIQTGDPKGDGSGGPGYKFNDELSKAHQYEPGIVAMANAGPNTNGSQFFICTGEDSKNLNQMPNYTIFGKIVEGMDVVQKIASTPVKESRGELSSPTEKVTIQSVEIAEK